MARAIPYSPEIDGLRAVAVATVVLFHFGFGCPGGYVGVDVFFVISGFLITSLIWSEIERDAFTFAGFWERRARRIIPALAVVIVATLAAGWFILLPEEFKVLGAQAAWQAVFAANIHYWRGAGYFVTAANERALLHTWSLAIEEQFYFVMPALLWLLSRARRTQTRTTTTAVLLVLLVASFAVNVYWVNRAPVAAFYLLPARMWELLVGSVISFLAAGGVPLSRPRRELIELLGLGLILFAATAYTAETPFPGIAALAPVAGAALLIWTMRRPPADAATTVETFLASKPVVLVGLMSYSIYLWHWPFIAFARYRSLGSVTIGQRLLLLAAALGCAAVSWKFVETPFRTRSLGASRRSMFTWASAALTGVLALGLLCIAGGGFPRRFPDAVLALADARHDRAFLNELSADDVRSGKLPPIGAAGGAPTVLVWGDSHAMAALPAMDAVLRERGVAGRAATHSATPPALDWYSRNAWSLEEASLDFNDAVFRFIETARIRDVFLSACWSCYMGESGANTMTFGQALVATVRRLVDGGVHTWVLLDVPSHAFDVPRTLSRLAASGSATTVLESDQMPFRALDGLDAPTRAGIEAAGGRLIDPKPRFLDAAGRHYVVQMNGVVLYADGEHLTATGATLVLAPLLRETLPR